MGGRLPKMKPVRIVRPNRSVDFVFPQNSPECITVAIPGYDSKCYEDVLAFASFVGPEPAKSLEISFHPNRVSPRHIWMVIELNIPGPRCLRPGCARWSSETPQWLGRSHAGKSNPRQRRVRSAGSPDCRGPRPAGLPQSLGLGKRTRSVRLAPKPPGRPAPARPKSSAAARKLAVS